jgi:capsular polysaccharide biosynthesis protein
MKVNFYRIILFLLTGNIFTKFIINLFSGQIYQALQFENIESFVREQKQRFKYLNNKSTTLSYSPPNFDIIDFKQFNLNKVEGFRKYSGIFNQAEVIGGSSLILLGNHKALYDIKYYDKKNKIRYSDQGIKYYKNEYCLVKIANSRSNLESGIFLGGNYSWNYYHLLYEIIAKVEQINNLVVDDSIPILVDKICMDVPQYQELFSYFFPNNVRFILLEKGKSYLVKKLYYFSCPNIIPPNYNNDNLISPEDVLFDLSTIDYLREKLFPHKSEMSFPKRIFISRKKASNRRLFNEKEVFEVLSNYGFEVVYPEDYSIADQITLFNNADYIAGGSGAAFANLLFCNKDCKALIFMRNKIHFSGFSTIAKHIGVDLVYITQEVEQNSEVRNIHESFVINTVKFTQFLSVWL